MLTAKLIGLGRTNRLYVHLLELKVWYTTIVINSNGWHEALNASHSDGHSATVSTCSWTDGACTYFTKSLILYTSPSQYRLWCFISLVHMVRQSIYYKLQQVPLMCYTEGLGDFPWISHPHCKFLVRMLLLPAYDTKMYPSLASVTLLTHSLSLNPYMDPSSCSLCMPPIRELTQPLLNCSVQESPANKTYEPLTMANIHVLPSRKSFASRLKHLSTTFKDSCVLTSVLRPFVFEIIINGANLNARGEWRNRRHTWS